jgi:hypothetical protein
LLLYVKKNREFKDYKNKEKVSKINLMLKTVFLMLFVALNNKKILIVRNKNKLNFVEKLYNKLRNLKEAKQLDIENTSKKNKEQFNLNKKFHSTTINNH